MSERIEPPEGQEASASLPEAVASQDAPRGNSADQRRRRVLLGAALVTGPLIVAGSAQTAYANGGGSGYESA